MLDRLPRDILNDILLRLNPKALIRCTLISKPIQSHITRQEFIDTHIQSFTKTATPQVFFRYMPRGEKRVKFIFEDDNEQFSGFNSDAIRVSFGSDGQYFTVVGSINGLICLCTDTRLYVIDALFLWNPSINKWLEVPRPIIRYRTHGTFDEVAWGFGYDSMANDYKIVRVVHLDDGWGECGPPLVDIYSLRTGTWRFLGDGPQFMIWRRRRQNYPCFLNGYVHWHGSCEDEVRRTVVVTFDMSLEVFGAIEIPICLIEKNFRVMEYRGMLALIELNCDSCKLWVMLEYGLVDSWTMVFDFSHSLGRNVKLKQIGFTKDGGLLVCTRLGTYFEKNLVMALIDPTQREVRMLGGITGMARTCYMSNYVESMVLFKEGKRCPEFSTDGFPEIVGDDKWKRKLRVTNAYCGDEARLSVYYLNADRLLLQSFLEKWKRVMDRLRGLEDSNSLASK